MSRSNWEADKMLDAYIYDYLVKRKLQGAAKVFQAEANISKDPVVIDAPGGFLFEWWCVFWDIFIAVTRDKHSEAAASYIESQSGKADLQQQQPLRHQQQMQMQQLLLQKHAQLQQQKQLQREQQQWRVDGQQLQGAAGSFAHNDAARNKLGAGTNVLGTRIYEDRLKLPLQSDPLVAAVMKKRSSSNMNQLLDQNNESKLKAVALGGQSSGKKLHGTSGATRNLHQAQNLDQEHPVYTLGTESEINAMRNSRASGTSGLLIGVQGSNQAENNLTLKGWPLMGLDQLGVLQHQRLLQAPHSLNKVQLQQQLLLQSHQFAASQSVNNMEPSTLHMLLHGQGIAIGKKAPCSGDVHGDIDSIPVAIPLLPRGDTEIPLQQRPLQNNDKQQQHHPQHSLSSQRSQSSNHLPQQHEKLKGSGSAADGSMSNSFNGNEQASKCRTGRKRKKTDSSSGPANSSGTANMAAPSPSSPSTPSTRMPGDATSIPDLSHSASSRSVLMFGSDGLGTFASAPNELDRFLDNKTFDDNVDMFFSHDAADHRDTIARSVDKSITLSEIRVISASTSKVECCDFSSDGKLLATGGHDRKVTLWCTESFTAKSVLEENTQCITNLRFSPSILRIATSSADKTVRVWDVDNPGYSLRTFTGHSTTVASVDFHPHKQDLLCSCDSNGEMRYWSIKNGSCVGVVKGAVKMLFQPPLGRLLAAAAENIISIYDVETQVCRHKLQGHKSPISSFCWDSSGEYLASVSDDLVRVWNIGSGSKGECTHELACTGNKFHTSSFHPTYPSLLVIGCYEKLELWNFSDNKTVTLNAHGKLISALAVSKVTGLLASASHDTCVKLWK